MVSRLHPRLNGLICLCVILAVLAGCRPEPPAPSAQLPVKIQLGAEGVYTLDSAALAGLGLEGEDPASLELTYRGKTLPTWMDKTGKETGLYFYAPPNDSQASPLRYAVLARHTESGEPGGVTVAVPPAAGEPARLPLAFSYATLRLEENRVYQPMAEGGDRWLGASVAGGQPGETIKFRLPSAGEGGGRIRLHVWGSTSALENPDHHLLLSLNGQPLLDETWEGAGRQTLEAAIPPGAWLMGENSVQISLPGDTGAAAELAFLDWIELDYPVTIQAEQDRLTFTSAGGAHLPVGFSGAVAAVDVTDPYQPQMVTRDARAGFEGQAGRRYLLAGPRAILRPDAVLPLQVDMSLLDASTGADYLIVGPPDLLAPIQPLIQHRTAQGLVVRMIPLETIYDTFNGSLPEPEAVQALVRTSAGWAKTPRALLLVGDTTFDPMGYTIPASTNRLPTFWVNTVFGGQTASDLPFALPEGEHAPLLAVGRMPARTPEQVSILVEKILAFEAGGAAEESSPRILAVADPEEDSFTDDARTFLDAFGSGFTTELLTPEPGGASSAAVVEAVQRSGGLVGYFGHGSLNMWGKDRLFSSDDVASLNNGDHLPVFVTLTCLNGLFTHPKQNSLAEALIWQPQGGAAAVLAPTSLTLANFQALLSNAFVLAVKADPEITLGEALVSAQRSLEPTAPGRQDVLYTFLLFGDPMMRVFP